LLVVAFNDHPHVVVSPIAKDTVQLRNADGEKVAVHKILRLDWGQFSLTSPMNTQQSKIKWVKGRFAILLAA
jgi:hypothetical protein